MRSAWLWTAVTLVAIAGGSYGLYLYLLPEPLPEQVLYGNGHIEGTEVRIAAELPARVVESRIVEGHEIERGDLLVRLDDSDLRLEARRMEAEVEALEAERKRVESELVVWRHHLQTAERDLARYRELRARSTVSAQRLDQVEDGYREARGRVAALESQIDAVGKRTTAARAERKLIDNRLSKTRITAPIDGTVLVKAIESGEFLQVGQIVAILVDLRNMDLKVYIPERDIGKVKLGDAARVRVDAFPTRHFAAEVARVDPQAQFTPRDIHLPEERVRMVFGVTLAIENAEGVLKPGMPADAWILWQSGSEWPDRLFVPQ